MTKLPLCTWYIQFYESNYFCRKKRSFFDLFALCSHVLSGKTCSPVLVNLKFFMIGVVWVILYANTKCCCQILCHWRNVIFIELTIPVFLADEQTHYPLPFCPRRWCDTGFSALADRLNAGLVRSAIPGAGIGELLSGESTAGFWDLHRFIDTRQQRCTSAMAVYLNLPPSMVSLILSRGRLGNVRRTISHDQSFQ